MPEGLTSLTNDQRAALLGLLTDLPADDWGRTTACRDWPIHDVVAHLVEGELLFGRVYRGELRALTRDDLDALRQVERWTRADGETLRFSLWHHGSATQRVIDSRSESSWDRNVEILGRAGRLRDVLGRHFFDLALHSLDVTAALGTESLWGERLPAIVAYCVSGAPVALATGGVAGGPDVRVTITAAGTWTLAHREGSWSVEGADAPADVSLETDAETLVLATTGRLAAGEALALSKVEGDEDFLETLLAAWQLKG